MTANAFASGIVAGMSYALYTIVSQYAVERGYSSMTTTFYTFAFALISCVLLANFGPDYWCGEDGRAARRASTRPCFFYPCFSLIRKREVSGFLRPLTFFAKILTYP
ncbi:hypothetical protein [uncultured Sporomusa sp.]|uniref:EamA family transporter n=1 Tax=uncultured Sporomusa sp. TaxID=307249 RepID=UPI00258A7F78|nr:hypothetical protein [uncultured Sporomusa sp.]